jgi:Sugar (and other) transporter
VDFIAQSSISQKPWGFIGVFLFPILLSAGGLFAAESCATAVSVLGLLVTVFMLPETKGKSLEELSAEEADAQDARSAMAAWGRLPASLSAALAYRVASVCDADGVWSDATPFEVAAALSFTAAWSLSADRARTAARRRCAGGPGGGGSSTRW